MSTRARDTSADICWENRSKKKFVVEGIYRAVCSVLVCACACVKKKSLVQDRIFPSSISLKKIKIERRISRQLNEWTKREKKKKKND